MKNKILIGLCLIAATAEIGAGPMAQLREYLRSFLPGRSERKLEKGEYVTVLAKNQKGNHIVANIRNGDNGTAQGHQEQRILDIKAWEYIEFDDNSISGRYIIYDENEPDENKKFKVVSSLWWHLYLPASTSIIGAALVGIVVLAVTAKK